MDVSERAGMSGGCPVGAAVEMPPDTEADEAAVSLPPLKCNVTTPARHLSLPPPRTSIPTPSKFARSKTFGAPHGAVPSDCPIGPRYSVRLRAACAVFGTTPELLSERDVNPWFPLVVEWLGGYMVAGLAAWIFGHGTRFHMVYAAPLAVLVTITLVTPFALLRMPFKDVGTSLWNKTVTPAFVLALMWLSVAAAVLPASLTPFNSRFKYFVAATFLAFFVHLRSAWVVPDTAVPRDQAKWMSLLTVLAATQRSMDTLSDLGLGCSLYYAAHTPDSCAWDGRPRCGMYTLCSALVLCAACVDGLAHLALTLSPRARHERRAWIVIHCVALASEAAIFGVTCALKQHAGSRAIGLPLLVVSGFFTAVSFVVSVLGLRQAVKTLSAVVPNALGNKLRGLARTSDGPAVAHSP